MLNLKSTTLEKSEILKLYTKGYTNPQDYKIGLEYERLPINSTSFEAVDYWGGNGTVLCLEQFARKNGWDYIVDENNVVGLAK